MEAITGHPASSFDASFCNDFNDMLESTGFDQHMDAMQMLMANLCHESCGFRYMKEIDPGYYLDGRRDLGQCLSRRWSPLPGLWTSASHRP